jgi:hypothetical protein
MCKVTSVTVESAGCLLPPLGEAAHRWTIWTYRLCTFSHNNRPCNNQEEVNAPGTTDYGSRSGSCRVCDKETGAVARYEAAIAYAQKQYTDLVNEAWNKKEAEMEGATYEVETV